MTERILEVERLSRRFDGRDVVSDISFSARAGEHVALVGANGSGKTTVIRCVAGTVIPTGGRIAVAGYRAGTRHARRRIGLSLSLDRSFYLRLSGRENLLFFARVRGVAKGQAAREVRAIGEELELDFLDRRVDRYSTGMSQQLAFARALLGDPALLVLDEPTRSLDGDAVCRFWTAIERRPRCALLVATHAGADVSRCHTRIDLDAAAR
jgi:ABC-type multidrug transport system ATPase subunit